MGGCHHRRLLTRTLSINWETFGVLGGRGGGVVVYGGGGSQQEVISFDWPNLMFWDN